MYYQYVAFFKKRIIIDVKRHFFFLMHFLIVFKVLNFFYLIPIYINQTSIRDGEVAYRPT